MSKAVDKRSIPLLTCTEDCKAVFTASQVNAQHERDSAERKPACLLVISMFMRHTSSLFIAATQSDKRLASIDMSS